MSMAQKIREAAQAKRAEATEAWNTFATARKSAIDEGVDFAKDADALTKLSDLSRDFDTKKAEADTLDTKAAEAEGLEGKTAPAAVHPLRAAGPPVTGDERDTRTPGRKFVESDVYQQLVDSGVLSNEQIPIGTTHGVKVLDRAELKTLVTSGDTSGGALSDADRLPGWVALERRERRIAELVGQGTTDSDVVEYVEMTARTNAAAETAEAGATGDASGAAPESAITLAIVTSTVRDITHYIPVTKRALADAAQLESLIDAELRDGVLERLDSQILVGNGTAPNLRGILNTSGINTQALGADSRSDAIAKAITLIRLDFFEPDTLVLHPNDAEAIFLEKDTAGNYIYGPPSAPERGRVWGMSTVISPAITEGTGLLGNFRRGATLWTREGLQVAASDSHSDFFIRRMVAMLAVLRAAFAVQRPSAFSTITGI